MRTSNPLTIAIAGLGTVGAGLVRLLQTNGDLIAQRAGRPIAIRAVSARDRAKKRDCNLAGIAWVDNPQELAAMPGVDVVVELMGGAEGAARALAESTLKNGKHLVTANKALLAAHGASLARLAETHNAKLLFEASVCGGIPVIKTLREGLAGNNITLLRGILNGTCNYILTRMADAKLSFDDALKEAQAKGYAEADPAGDIDGHDTANKLAILAALAFDTTPDLAGVKIQGIRHITSADLKKADDQGCCIKLLGMAKREGGRVLQKVEPTLVPKTEPLAAINDVLNAVVFRSESAGDIALAGPGAGAGPTASAVMADIIDIARGNGHFKGLFVAK